MTPGVLDELREIFAPLTDDIDSEPYPQITTATLASRRETAA